jgi:hypothetical protein
MIDRLTSSAPLPASASAAVDRNNGEEGAAPICTKRTSLERGPEASADKNPGRPLSSTSPCGLISGGGGGTHWPAAAARAQHVLDAARGRSASHFRDTTSGLRYVRGLLLLWHLGSTSTSVLSSYV